MSNAIVKAQKFYFNQFLPAVLPYIILPPSSFSNCRSSAIKSPPVQSDTSVAKSLWTETHTKPENKIKPIPVYTQPAVPVKLPAKQPAVPSKPPAKQPVQNSLQYQ